MKKVIVASVLAPVLSLGLYAAPALAFGFDNVIIVDNDNSAFVVNHVSASASTGGNDANGGYGSSAGNGGDVNGSEDGNTGGNGGDGGAGGDGGVILTGNADASAVVINKVNTNKTTIEGCVCEDDTLLKVENENKAFVANGVEASAKTGHNDANGGSAGESAGGDGGSVNGSDDDNTGGNGGNAGAGGWGGGIGTGSASTWTKVVNRVNTNITRVLPSSVSEE